jgi:hypothetical protein
MLKDLTMLSGWMDYAYSSSRVPKQIREYYNIESGRCKNNHNSKQIKKQNGKENNPNLINLK